MRRVAPVSEPFNPPGARWTALDPRARTLWRTEAGLLAAALAAIGLIFWALISWRVGAVIVVVAGLAFAWIVGVIERQFGAWGYDVGADALTIRHGVLMRVLVVVPYARMQFVDVQAGPLERRFGLASVQLHTASAATDAKIPGIAAADAAALRDELARLGETRSVGL